MNSVNFSATLSLLLIPILYTRNIQFDRNRTYQINLMQTTLQMKKLKNPQTNSKHVIRLTNQRCNNPPHVCLRTIRSRRHSVKSAQRIERATRRPARRKAKTPTNAKKLNREISGGTRVSLRNRRVEEVNDGGGAVAAAATTCRNAPADMHPRAFAPAY